MMRIKAKDAVRDEPVLVAAAPLDSRQSRSSTLPSELVPHAASLACSGLRAFKNFTAAQEMNNTARSVVGRAYTGELHENTKLP
jgi:hypothetical protein